MRICLLLAASFACALAVQSSSIAQDVPAPAFDRIDYADADKYLALPKSMGKRETIQQIADRLKGDGPRAKLAAIGAWIDSRLKYDAKAAYAWRDFDTMLADGTYGGCADQSLVYGALARACGIPTVWVKTMDADWIRAFRRTGDENMTWSGHVFLEVHVDGKWMLLDASQGLIWADYDARQRILPGSRYAYDKGGDPHTLVLSTRWETWKEQTRRYFREFDVSQLPVGEGAPLQRQVFIAAGNPEWQLIADRCKTLQRGVGRSGNTGFEQWLPQASGQILIVVFKAGETVLPKRYHAMLPAMELRAERKSGVIRHKMEEGTRVIVVFGADAESLKTEIEKLTIPQD